MTKSKQYLKNPISSPLDITAIYTIYRIVYESEKRPYDTGESHDFYELVCVESGEYHVRLDGICQTVKEGELILYPPNALHSKGVEDSKALIYIVSFETAAPISFDIFGRPLPLTQKQHSLLSELFTDALEIEKDRSKVDGYSGMTLHGGQKSLAMQKLKNKLELLLIDLCEASITRKADISASNAYNADSTELTCVIEYLKANIKRSLTLNEIADACSMSVSKLKKLFAKNRGGGVIQYFNTMKIKEAKNMIRNTNMNFTQISEALGFSYPHYFSKFFKQKTGVTLSQYAKQIDKR